MLLVRSLILASFLHTPTWASELQGIRFETQLAEDWTEQFRRTEGWTGGDGIFSFRLPGEKERTLFVFSDTWIGSVDPASRQRTSMKLINNSFSLMEKGSKQTSWRWGKNNTAAFTPDRPKEWYWLQDGFVHGDHWYNFPMRVAKKPEGSEGFQFQTVGVDLLKVPLDDRGLDDKAASRIPMPLWAKSEEGEHFFGAGVLKNADDGFLYVYGRLHRKHAIRLTVARVRPEKVEEIDTWRFWDGSNWVKEMAASADLGDGGAELSVTRMEHGPLKNNYLLVTMQFNGKLFVRVADRPQGPFSEKHFIYTPPEPTMLDNIYTYNAKAHPTLSTDNALLISYNVNTPSLREQKNAEIYRPRFIWLKISRK